MTTIVRSIAPKETWQLLQHNPEMLLVDVRSSMEFLFVGHPLNAVHVAWIDEPDWEINPNFATEISKAIAIHLNTLKQEITKPIHQIPVVLICRSGVRSLEAGAVLCQEGFAEVYNVLEGFEGARDAENHRGTLGGWRFHGLPWEQC